MRPLTLLQQNKTPLDLTLQRVFKYTAILKIWVCQEFCVNSINGDLKLPRWLSENTSQFVLGRRLRVATEFAPSSELLNF